MRWISLVITAATILVTTALAIGSKPSRDYVDEQDRRVATEARYERERMEARIERQYGEILKRLDHLAESKN